MLVKHSKPFKSYPFNVISLSKSFSEQLVKEKVYLVIEAYFDFRLNKSSEVLGASYRIVDEEGTPAIYDANGFEIVSGNLDGYYFLQDSDDHITITHKLIFEAGTNTFWEVYFDNPTSKERTLLENVVKDLSFREGIPAPTLEHNDCF